MFNLKEVIDLYINSLRSDRKSENTIKNYSGVLNRFVNFCNTKGIDIDFQDTKAFKRAIESFKGSIDSYNKGKKSEADQVKYIETSINAYRSCMRSFIKYLYKLHYIDENFGDDIESVKIDTGQKKEVLNYEELSLIKEMLDKDVQEAVKEEEFIKARNRFAFWLILTTGVREEEAVNIKWEHIDIAKGNRIYIDKGKGKKSRYVPIMPQFKGAIYDYQTIIRDLMARGYKIESEYVLSSYRKHGKAMSTTNIYHIIKDIIVRSGIKKKITPHNLRHTFSSIAIDKKVKLPTLSKWLGHANPNVTAQVYIHELSEKESAEEMEKLNGALPI